MLENSKSLSNMSTSLHMVSVADAHLAEGQLLHNSIHYYASIARDRAQKKSTSKMAMNNL
jgi:hypothetical protein